MMHRAQITPASLALAVLFGLAACGGGGGDSSTPNPPPTPPATQYTPSGKAAAGDAFVHLFEWRWDDIARECEVFLGPKGYAAVQISPPNEHAVITNRPWYERYQPVSYKLDQSRSGTLAQFTDMVNRCKAVGVGIYVDAVINHMAADTGINGQGSSGSAYQRYSYPAVPWARDDFHTACTVNNYQNAGNVQNCELVGLPDLKTEAETVRQKIADYLIALHRAGVAGFRVDAAKHIAPADLDAILGKVNAAARSESRPAPYVFLEVINNSGEAVKAEDYFGAGFSTGGVADVTEFQYGYRVSDAFLGRNNVSVASLQNIAASLMPANKAVVFVDNHDNQRGNNAYYADGAFHELAVVFTLTQATGYPSIMSSYGFDRASQAGRDRGPPADSNGRTESVFDAAGASRCSATSGGAQVGAWVCEHRRRAVSNAVAFRKFTAGSAQVQWQNLNANAIAYAREGKGFVAFNRDTAAVSAAAVRTTLPAGRYCDVANGDFDAARKTCSGNTVLVSADGGASVDVPPRGAVMLHGGAKVE